MLPDGPSPAHGTMPPVGSWEIILLGSAVVLAGVVAAAFAERLGAPALLLFLGLGLLLGEDGPGGINFDDFHLAEILGSVALALILFEGGLAADQKALRRVVVPATLLATVGVAVTALVVAAAAHLVFDLDATQSLLVGAVVSSTDAAAVFAAVRGLAAAATPRRHPGGRVRSERPARGRARRRAGRDRDEPGRRRPGRRLAPVQAARPRRGRRPADRARLHRGAAAPVAAVVRALSGRDDGRGPRHLRARRRDGRLRLPRRLPAGTRGRRGAPAATPGLVHGFHEAAGWIAQIGLFVLLGLLVTPSRLPDQGFEPIVVAFALVLVARPLAVLASTLGQRFDWRERAFLSWAGLRGAVPIVFATFPVVGGVEDSLRIFDVVFYVVVVSVVVQGLGLRRVANALGVADERPAVRMAEIDVATLRSLGAELVELEAGTAGIEAGRPLRDLRLPGGGIVAAIRRGDQIVPPRGSTVVETGDRLYLLVERERLEEVERALSG